MIPTEERDRSDTLHEEPTVLIQENLFSEKENNLLKSKAINE